MSSRNARESGRASGRGPAVVERGRGGSDDCLCAAVAVADAAAALVVGRTKMRTRRAREGKQPATTTVLSTVPGPAASTDAQSGLAVKACCFNGCLKPGDQIVTQKQMEDAAALVAEFQDRYPASDIKAGAPACGMHRLRLERGSLLRLEETTGQEASGCCFNGCLQPVYYVVSEKQMEDAAEHLLKRMMAV